MKMKKVFCLGVWDLFHMGHLNLLYSAYKGSGEGRLIVGVVKDAAVRRQKGQNRPIIPYNERLEIVRSLWFVKETVWLDGFFIPKAIIDQCDLIVVGADQSHIKNLPEIPKSKRLDLPRYVGTSTSDIIKRIKNEPS